MVEQFPKISSLCLEIIGLSISYFLCITGLSSQEMEWTGQVLTKIPNNRRALTKTVTSHGFILLKGGRAI